MDIEKLLDYVKKYKNIIEFINIEEILIDSSRGGEKKKGVLKIAVPDEVVKNLRGDPEKRDLILIVHIPNEIRKKIESPLIIL